MNHFEKDYPLAEARLLDWVKAGAIKYKEDVREGFEYAPGRTHGPFSRAAISESSS